MLIDHSDNIPAFGEFPPMAPWGINFGAGTNSWAMAIQAHRRGLRPDWVLFADTGSELPETYRSVDQFAAWCAVREWPFQVVRWIREDGSFESIHDNCLRTNYLPSKAYGLAGCTTKWKIAPMHRWRKANGYENTAVAIGYDNGEEHRKRSASKRACSDPEANHGEVFWYPLIAWGIDRAGCVDICRSEGVVVGKSSCFMCPNMRADEWDYLQQNHPDLYRVAEQIESQAIANNNARSASIFRSAPRQIECSCFIETLPEGSWMAELM